MSRTTVFFLTVLVFAAPALAEEPFNVSVDIGWGGCYRPMEWTPIQIGISSNLKDYFGGAVTTSAQQDDLTEMVVGHRFVVTPGLPVNIPLVVKLAYAADGCDVRILDEHGRTAWRHNYTLWDFSSSIRKITPVNENDLLIGLAGRNGFGLMELPKRSICSAPNLEDGKIHLQQKLPQHLPWDWTGYASLDLLVLYDPDWDLMNTHQAQAIIQWVSNGGKLLVVLGSHHLNPDNPIARALPFQLGQVKQIAVPPAALGRWKCKVAPGIPVAHWPVTARSDTRFCTTETYGALDVLVARGCLGFGRVGLLSFDPSVLTPNNPDDTAKFWVRHFSMLLADPEQDPPPTRQIQFAEKVEPNKHNPYHSTFEGGQASEPLNAVLTHLLSIPELQPLSIWWVILLLAALGLLLGPVDYLVLRRLGRLPLTWITSAFCILVFTVGAYYGVYALRAGANQLRAVSVLDAVQDCPYPWSTVYSGLFASSSADYSLDNLQTDQWWSATSPRRDHYYGYRRDFGGRKIYCSQHDGGNLPNSLPINIWSMQCLVCESPVQKFPITASLQQTNDGYSLSITNNSDHPIARGMVRFDGNQALEFGSVPPQQTSEFHGQLTKAPAWRAHTSRRTRSRRPRTRAPGTHITASLATENAFLSPGCLKRTQAIQSYLRHGAAVVCAQYDDVPTSFRLANRKCNYAHTQLVRLVVFPEKDQ